MRLLLTGTHKGVAFTAKPAPADFIRFERIFGKPISALGEGRIEWVAWLAWSYLHRNGHTTEPFEIWTENLDDLDDQTEAPVPLAQAPTTT